MAKKEQLALESAKKNIRAINNNVSKEIQAVFDKLSMMYQCEWKDNSIIIMEQFVINPPYESVTALPNKDSKGIDRIIMIVSSL